jgi:hypothetical protein
MAKLSVYEPPMCCSTGVCGPDGEDKLAQFASTLDWAKRSGHQVERYDLGHSPGAFASNAFVRGMIEKEGMGVLPIVLVDGEILVKGDYPSRDAVSSRLSGGKTEAACCGASPAKTEAKADACCTPAPAKSANETACCTPAPAKAAAKSSCC